MTTSKQLGECIYCSALSFACTSIGKSCHVNRMSNMMTCVTCNSMLCKDCITEIINFVDQCPAIPSQVKADDSSFQLLKTIQTFFDLGYDTILTGPSCSFITPNECNLAPSSSSILQCPPLPLPISSQGRVADIRFYRRSINQGEMGERDKLILQNYGLEKYYDQAHCTSHEGMFQHKENPSKQLRRALYKNKKRRCQQVNQSTTYNSFSGAMVLPAFGLLIQGEVTITYWYCDHLSLARSSVDGTPDVMHCVLDDSNAKLHHATMKDSSLSRISGSREIIKLAILAPEDISKKRMMTVEVIQLPQVLPIVMVATMKGMTTLSISSIMTMSFFGSEDMRNDVDVTMISGNFTIDQNKHPKLLLLRFSDMLANHYFSIEARHTMARDLYHQLR
jgi:hypothetical protein